MRHLSLTSDTCSKNDSVMKYNSKLNVFVLNMRKINKCILKLLYFLYVFLLKLEHIYFLLDGFGRSFSN